MKQRLFLLLALLLVGPVFAQNHVNGPPTDTTQSQNPEASDSSPADEVEQEHQSLLDSFELMLSLAVLLFGAIVIASQAYLAVNKVISSEHIFKSIILTLVILGALLLVTAGYSNNQITGVSGILGSIAGYMLAKTNLEKDKSETNPEPNKAGANQQESHAKANPKT